MKKTILLSVLLILVYGTVTAQFTRYIVRFKNKGNASFTLANPSAYLSQRAIDRRTRYNILYDSTDLPVTPAYITQLRNVPNVTVLNVSKWLNAASIETTDANAITTISGFSFVSSVNGLAAKPATEGRGSRNKFALEEDIIPLPVSSAKGEGVMGDFFNYGSNSYNEIHLHNGEFLHNIGMRGQGMQLAVLDGGFMNYTSLKAFDSANANGQILGTWDFVNRESSVVEDHPHGMQCLSTIAANIPGEFVGKAPKASFYLFRTEDVASEYPIEELNWVCGAERADSSGVEVISSSLGYYDFDNATFNYTYANMDGNTTMAVKGADLAAKKGILVFNSVGNEGGNAWNFLVTPSDGDSVVAVGAVSAAGNVGAFSSYGPSADGQIKPDMASVGVAALVQTTSNTVGASNGTSFACPNMAGLGTILWQAFPEFSNMKIIQALKQAGNKFNVPDNRTGFGIPNMKLAFANLLVDYSTATASTAGCTATVNWNSKDVSAMKYEIERKAPGESVFTKVGEMSALGNTVLSNRTYSFSNSLAALQPGTVSYRIRQIVDTSVSGFTAVYVDTITATVEAGCLTTGTGNTDPVNEKVTVQPNPVNGHTAFLVVETAYAIPELSIRIYDAKGSLIYTTQSNKGTGKKTIELSLAGLSAGTYFISVYNGKKWLAAPALIKR